MKIKFNTDDDIPLNKHLSFLTIKVIIRCVFEKMMRVTHKFIYMTLCIKYKNDSVRRNWY